ncbi:Diacylglycerol kinase family enzyme [Noviherbaspirillum humi]|uniref:Diacylglycerol kinase family enzyme n=1 Tax=Noviherbaspirillum humi TaxID=1688639 RepID=A0A239JHG6_9BURK|nr:diacylglycerol kinase family protein [Noviherbaspirillum humi]SNT04164.1 Diacylglycerol kinase family enzyme [Noviherbaspirillum humi]
MTDIQPVQALPSASPAAGRRITVILNLRAGSGEKPALRQAIEEALAPAGDRLAIVDVAPPARLAALCDRHASEAATCGGMLVAVGGDGTINAVASACLRHGVAMGVIPAGTFNYFARQLGIPQDAAEAARLLLAPALRRVTVAKVNEQVFLNNASFGLYSRIIREREQDKARFGRSRIVAVLSAVATLLAGYRPFAVKIASARHEQVRRTAMVFVCHNELQLARLELDAVQCARERRLAVLLLRPVTRFGAAKLLWHGATRRLNQNESLETFCADAFSAATRKRRIDVVVDGEIVRLATPLDFRILPDALTVAVPHDGLPA